MDMNNLILNINSLLGLGDRVSSILNDGENTVIRQKNWIFDFSMLVECERVKLDIWTEDVQLMTTDKVVVLSSSGNVHTIDLFFTAPNGWQESNCCLITNNSEDNMKHLIIHITK